MANEQPAAPESVAPAKAKLPILIGMVVVGLAIGGGTGAMFLGPMVARKMGKVMPTAADTAHATSSANDAEPSAEATDSTVNVYVLDNMVLNPAGSGGSRYLLLSVAIEAGSATTLASFKARDAELRDIVLSTLGTKAVDQLVDVSAREGFKAEIVTSVDERFGKKSVTRIYFPQFVVQ